MLHVTEDVCVLAPVFSKGPVSSSGRARWVQRRAWTILSLWAGREIHRGGQSSGAPCSGLPESRGGAIEANTGIGKEEKYDACSVETAMILRIAEILCRIASEIGDLSLDWLIDLMHSASSECSVFTVAKWRARNCRQLALVQGEQIIVANGFEKRALKTTMGGLRREAWNYRLDVR